MALRHVFGKDSSSSIVLEIKACVYRYTQNDGPPIDLGGPEATSDQEQLEVCRAELAAPQGKAG